MNAHDEDRFQQLLRQSLPPVGEVEPARDLWPVVVRRINARPSAPPWFDWALAGGLVAFAAFVPVSIPVLLYYL
jgi:hypothetical protein